MANRMLTVPVKLCNSHISLHRCRCGCSTPRPLCCHDALVQNDPLYLRTFTSNNPSSASSPSSVPFASSSLNPAAAGPLNWNNDQGLKFHYFVHTSLDAIEEKSTNPRMEAMAMGRERFQLGVGAPCSLVPRCVGSVAAAVCCCFAVAAATVIAIVLTSANKSKRSGTSVALPGDLYLGQLFTVEEYKM